MAMTDIQTYTLRYDQSLIQRVAVEIAKAAQFVIAGGPASPETPLYMNARRAMGNPVDETAKFMWFVVTDATVQANGSDPNATTDAQLAQIIATHYPVVWGG